MGSILTKPITINFSIRPKIYDKIINNPIINYTLSGIYDIDLGIIDILPNFYGYYKGINSGYQIVDISNINIIDNLNYSVPYNYTAVYSYINKKSISGSGINKIYDSTTNAELLILGTLSNDIIYYSANFINKDVSNNISITISNIIYGPQYMNYYFTNNITFASIFKKIVKPIFNNIKTIDDGDDLYKVILRGTLSGIYASDDPVLFSLLDNNNSVFSLGKYGINPWSNNSYFIDKNAEWIWTISGAEVIAPINTIGYQIHTLYTNNTNNIINATVHLLSDDICNFYLNGNYISSSITGGYTTQNYSKIQIKIPVGINILMFESYNLGFYPNPAGILVSVINNNNSVLINSNSSWVYSINSTVTNNYERYIIYGNTYIATITSTVTISICDISYTGLTLVNGKQSNYIKSSNYYIEPNGLSIVNFIQKEILVNFYSLNKIYDKNIQANVIYTLSGIALEYRNNISSTYIDISSTYIAEYRTYNSSNKITIDIYNVKLYGSLTIFYYIKSSIYQISGFISQRYIYPYTNKIYDKNTQTILTLSNKIESDIIEYIANYDNYNVGTNKLVYITLSNQINELISDLNYKLYFNYSFDKATVNDIYIGNTSKLNEINYDSYLTVSNMISTLDYKVDNGAVIFSSTINSLTINNTNDVYVLSGDRTYLNCTGIALSKDKSKMILSFNNSIVYARYNNIITDDWTIIYDISYSQLNFKSIAITGDGNRFITCASNNLIYFSNVNNISLQPILDTIRRNYSDIDITYDGNRLIASVFNDYIYFSDWNGINYNILTPILNINIRNYSCIGISPDGLKIVYGANDTEFLFIAIWKNYNYTDETILDKKLSITNINKCKFGSNDNIIHILTTNNSITTLLYYRYNFILDTYVYVNTIYSNIEGICFSTSYNNT